MRVRVGVPIFGAIFGETGKIFLDQHLKRAAVFEAHGACEPDAIGRAPLVGQRGRKQHRDDAALEARGEARVLRITALQEVTQTRTSWKARHRFQRAGRVEARNVRAREAEAEGVGAQA